MTFAYKVSRRIEDFLTWTYTPDPETMAAIDLDDDTTLYAVPLGKGFLNHLPANTLIVDDELMSEYLKNWRNQVHTIMDQRYRWPEQGEPLSVPKLSLSRLAIGEHPVVIPESIYRFDSFPSDTFKYVIPSEITGFRVVLRSEVAAFSASI
jgi:hypothetical protein